VARPDHPPILVGPIAALHTIEPVVRPRWVVWSQDTTAALVESGVRAATAWDVAAVHRLLSGGWRAEPAAHGLAIDGLPAVGSPDHPRGVPELGHES
jgi:DNA polymerase-1